MKWSLVILGVVSLIAGIVEIADAYQGLNPIWDTDGLWTGIILLIFGFIGLLGLQKRFWKKPFFWEGA